VRVRAETAAPEAARKPGAFVDVTVAARSPQQVLAVPLAAVRRAAYGDHVYVIGEPAGDDESPRAEQRFVRTGPTIGRDIVILEGLAAGERVATEGSFKLRQGAVVRIAAPEARAGVAPQPAGPPPGS
jgi:membrane fusion protein (multidrug efflux system)